MICFSWLNIRLRFIIFITGMFGLRLVTGSKLKEGWWLQYRSDFCLTWLSLKFQLKYGKGRKLRISSKQKKINFYLLKTLIIKQIFSGFFHDQTRGVPEKQAVIFSTVLSLSNHFLELSNKFLKKQFFSTNKFFQQK